MSVTVEEFKQKHENWKQTQSVATVPQLMAVLRKWLYLESSDREFIEVILAASLDREVPGDPVWLYAVAPPGGLKSELLRAIGSAYKKAFTLDTLTPATFVSGVAEKNKESGEWEPIAGLLQDLDGKTLIVKDFTTILNANEDTRTEIYGQLRSIYDGYFERGYGTMRRKVSVNAIIGLVVGVTPIVDRYTKLQGALGERFLKIRNEPDRIEATKQAMRNEGRETQMRVEIRNAIESLIKSLDFTHVPALTEEQNNYLIQLAHATATLRSATWNEYDVNGHIVDSTPTIEIPTRLVKQLRHLTKLIGILRRHPEITEEDLKTIQRVAHDTVHPKRMKIIDFMYRNGKTNQYTAQDLAGATGIYRNSLNGHLLTLEALGVLEMDDRGDYGIKPSYLPTIEALYTTLPGVTLQTEPDLSLFSKVTPERIAPTLRDRLQELTSTLTNLQFNVCHGAVQECLVSLSLGWTHDEYQRIRDTAKRDGTVFSPRPFFLGATRPSIFQEPTEEAS